MWVAAIFALTVLSFSCGSGNENGVINKYAYYKSGKVQSITPHVDGKPHGIKLEYYEDGALRMEVPYENGIVNGEVKFYYPDGKVYSVTPRVQGNIEGEVIKYHKNGKVLSITPYQNDELLPGLKEFDDKGSEREGYNIVFSEKATKRGSELQITLEMKITPAIRSAKFYQIVELTDSTETNIAIPVDQETGKLLVYLPKGASIDKPVRIRSEFVTRFHNRGALVDQYHLKKRN